MANLSSSTSAAARYSNAYLASKQGSDRTADLGPTPRNSIHQGDCTLLMTGMEANSVDFILTDPPYITRYRGRDGRTVANDDNTRWLKPAFAEMHRLLKPGGLALSPCLGCPARLMGGPRDGAPMFTDRRSNRLEC